MTEKTRGLSGDIISGLFWTASGKGAQGLLHFLVMILLARLMSPLEFGVVGAALIVVGFSEILTRLGLGPALVQRSEIEPRHLGTAFSVSIAVSLLIGILIWISAPAVAGFFRFEGIENVLRVLAWLFPIRGLSVVADALAHRGLRFKWLAGAEALSFAIGYFGFGIGLALLGFGVWSLVAANLVYAAAKTTALLIAYPPKQFFPERPAFRELMYFGGGFTIARVFNYLALQGDNIVVGRALGLVSLGIYGRAYQLMAAPASMFGQVLDDVLFPSMAKMQNDRERLANSYLRGVALIALVTMPAGIVAFILAPEIVNFVLGPQWIEVVWPFRILTVGLLFRTSYKLSDSLARATGAVYRRAWRQGIYAGAVIGGAWIGHFWGVAGVACGVFGALLINFLLMAQMSLDLVGETWRNFLRAHSNAAFLAVAAGLAALPAVELLRRFDLSAFYLLSIVAVYLAVLLLLAIRFAPQRFLGADGLWMLNVLKQYVPDKLANKFSFGRNHAEPNTAASPTAAASGVGPSG